MFIGLTESTASPTNVGPETLLGAIGLAQISSDSTNFHLIGSQSSPFSMGISYLSTAPIVPTANRLYRLELYAYVQGFYDFVLTDIANGAVASTSIQGPTGITAFRAWRSNGASSAPVGLDIAQVIVERTYGES